MPPESQISLRMTFDCLPCVIGSLVTLIRKDLVPEDKREPAMRALLDHLSRADFRASPPQLGRELHRLIRKILDNPDPYLEIKRDYNRLMLGHYPRLKKLVDGSSDPLATALRLAIAGNIIDFGPNRPFDVDAALERSLTVRPAVDDSEALRKDLSRARTLLYLGDNAGEIVTDRILLETIRHPHVDFAVRGAPVINDATIEDALAVGMDKIARVVTSGDDAPGILLDSCSPEFRRLFDRADLIIAKGQGNFEGLYGTGKTVYFLLTAKCDLVAGRLGVRKGDFIIAKS